MYLALARKYRPQKFEDLIGQPHITKTLQNAITMDKLYAGLIFSGIKGVGKTSASRILAKALNCVKGPATEPCNECESCTEITKDKSPDYIEIDGASNNGVEEIRNLKERVKYKPLKSRYRVVVIDEVHMLSNSAWNALLKTIEEPPEHTYFIMATTDFHKIPATIVSRCQHFEFKRIPYEIIVSLLKNICEWEKVKVSDYALFLISKAADGSLRDAKKILDQSIALSHGPEVKDQNVIAILGVIEEDLFLSLTQAVFARDRKAILVLLNDMAERGMDLRFFYSEYLKFFRDLMVLKTINEADQRLYNLNPENVPRIREMLNSVREVELLRYFNAAKDMELTIRNTENPRIILEYLFLKLSYYPSLISIEEFIQQGEGAAESPSASRASVAPTSVSGPVKVPAEKASGSGSPAPAPPPYIPPADTPEAGDPLDRLLRTSGASENTSPEQYKFLIIERVNRDKPRWAPALEGAVFRVEPDRIVITFPEEFELARNSMNENLTQFTGMVHEAIRRKYAVALEVDHNLMTDEKRKIEALRKDEKINDFASKLKTRIASID